jgi:transcriptional regulator with XRE-family HTH domain
MSTVKRKSEKKSRRPAEIAYRAGFGLRVRQIRVALRMTQAEMSAALGRANNDPISRLERGQAEMLPFDMLAGLQMMAVQAGYSAAWLLSGEGFPIPPSETASRLLSELHRLASAAPPEPSDKEI